MTVTAFARPLAAFVSIALAGAPSLAAADTCFTAFSGTVNIQFAGTITGAGHHTLTGVIFGSLSACAGLTHWPVIGAAYTESGSIVVAFRSETVDSSSCGAVDEIANLTPSTLTGPLQLHNDRNNFSNTSTLTKSACVTVPPAGRPTRLAAGRDVAGN